MSANLLGPLTLTTTAVQVGIYLQQLVGNPSCLINTFTPPPSALQYSFRCWWMTGSDSVGWRNFFKISSRTRSSSTLWRIKQVSQLAQVEEETGVTVGTVGGRNRCHSWHRWRKKQVSQLAQVEEETGVTVGTGVGTNR